MPDTEKVLLLRFLDLLMGGGDAATLREVVAEDFVAHDTAGPDGPDGVLAFAQQLRTAFPDLRYEVEECLGEGAVAAARIAVTGVQTGPMPGSGMAASGKPVALRQMHMVRIADGKVAEHWSARDDLSLMIQLGAFPAPAAPGWAVHSYLATHTV